MQPLRLQSYALKQTFSSFYKEKQIKLTLVGRVCRPRIRQVMCHQALLSVPTRDTSQAGSLPVSREGVKCPITAVAVSPRTAGCVPRARTGLGPVLWQPAWDLTEQNSHSYMETSDLNLFADLDCSDSGPLLLSCKTEITLRPHQKTVKNYDSCEVLACCVHWGFIQAPEDGQQSSEQQQRLPSSIFPLGLHTRLKGSA